MTLTDPNFLEKISENYFLPFSDISNFGILPPKISFKVLSSLAKVA